MVKNYNFSVLRRDKLTEEEIRDKFYSYWQKQRVSDKLTEKVIRNKFFL